MTTAQPRLFETAVFTMAATVKAAEAVVVGEH